MSGHSGKRWAVVGVAFGLLMAGPAGARPSQPAQTVVDIEFVADAVVPTGQMFAGTEIGGLSSITYDPARGGYEVLSDDQGNRPTGDPVRTYTVKVDLADALSGDAEVEFVAMTELLDLGGEPYAPGGLDPEGFTVGREGSFFMSSEGNSFGDPIIDPFIRRYNRNGRVTATLPIPEHYLPNGVDQGVRFNLAFESLNPTPNGRMLVTAAEGALFQDGPASTYFNPSLARILVYDLQKRAPVAEYAYEVGPWAEPSTIFGVNGIVEVLPIDDAGTMLVMERSFSVGGILGEGTGNSVVIKEISTVGATDVLDVPALAGVTVDPVSQRQVFSFDALGIPIDNLEGMTFGPILPDGRQSLVIVSDNNFNAGQFTQFIVLALEVAPSG